MTKTDDEILDEWLELCEADKAIHLNHIRRGLLAMVQRCRKEEPRINSGVHLYDFSMICNVDGSTMDSFYGEDYFDEE